MDRTDAIAQWYLRLSEKYMAEANLEGAMKATHVAAWVMKIQNRSLASIPIEENLQAIAKQLPEKFGAKGKKKPFGMQKEWLHVINQALPFGGHTAMMARWIRADRERKHSVALLSQRIPVPNDLIETIRECGGDVYRVDVQESFVTRAIWLRKLTSEVADCVVLHIDVDDVIAPVGLGGSGGPPVLLVNHAAHLFWAGVSIADVVINCRGSEQERDWTLKHRGARRCSTLPIPLIEQPQQDEGRDFTKDKAKQELGLDPESLLILSSGEAYKYSPLQTLNFVETISDMLLANPQANLIVVGPEENAHWKAARVKTGSRMRAVGRMPRSQVCLYLRAADIYVEGFPFGSTTALLEAGLHGIPVVLAPSDCPPPFGSDGVALDEVIERPNSIEAYKSAIDRLLMDPDLRSVQGALLAKSIRRHHTERGWQRYLDELINELPPNHSVSSLDAVSSTAESYHEFWIQFARAANFYPPTFLEDSVAYAFATGLRPKDGLGGSWEGNASVLAELLTSVGD
ncbi:MAG: glycosyltransferase, partial [Limisphaerales bacterium]